jgi:ubiquinol-cytochrome c reductase cytochrome c subunit
MSPVKRPAVLGVALLAFATGVPAADAPAGNVARGKQLFRAHGCYQCHGYNGETGARDLVGTNSPLIADLATFTMFLRMRGDQAPLLPSTRMPNFPASALPDADVRDLFAYIRTFKLDAPEVKDVPALKAILESASRPRGK